MCFNYEQCDWSRTTTRRARKAHPCEGCNVGIKPGELYEYTAVAHEGRLWTERACEACIYTRALIYAQERAEGCMHHESWCAVQDVRDHAHEYGWWSPHIRDGRRDTEVHTVVRLGDWREAA